jgi:preprotein translocase subunit YajC
MSNIAHAAETATNLTSTIAPPDAGPNLILLVAIFAIFYFFIIRPQSNRQKQQQALIAGVKKGDKVIIAGALIATIIRDEGVDTAIVETSEGAKLQVLKSSISGLAQNLNQTNQPKNTNKN